MRFKQIKRGARTLDFLISYF
jgi:hypothetical protein